MRFLAIMFSLLLASCGGSSDNAAAKPIPANDKLNGFWNGQINQSGEMRMLVYNGEVFARYEGQGYYGSFTFSDSNERVTFALKSAPFSLNDSAGQQFATPAVYQSVTMSGQLFQAAATVQMWGSVSAQDNGEFALTQDNSWRAGGDLLNRASTWQTEGYRLVIGNKATFEGNSLGTSSNKGCFFNGRLLSVGTGMYLVNLDKRDKCSYFNQVAIGFAALNADGELEFYLRNGGQLLFMAFAPTAAEAPPEGDTDAGDGDGDAGGGGDASDGAGTP